MRPRHGYRRWVGPGVEDSDSALGGPGPPRVPAVAPQARPSGCAAAAPRPYRPEGRSAALRAQHPFFFILGCREQARRTRRVSFIPLLIHSTPARRPLLRRSPRPGAVSGPLPFLTGSVPTISCPFHRWGNGSTERLGRLIWFRAALAWRPCPSPAENKGHPRKRAEGWERG